MANDDDWQHVEEMARGITRAMVAGGRSPVTGSAVNEGIVRDAFALAEVFVAEARKRRRVHPVQPQEVGR